jgi:hypothetical protein
MNKKDQTPPHLLNTKVDITKCKKSTRQLDHGVAAVRIDAF